MDLAKALGIRTEVPSTTQRRPLHPSFCCSSEKLAVELDGEDHFMPWGITYDNERKRYLNRVGIKVIRFENEDVFRLEEWVLNEIRKEFGWRQRDLDARIKERTERRSV